MFVMVVDVKSLTVPAAVDAATDVVPIPLESSLLGSYLETLNLKLWSIQGCHELYASLGFDLMEVGTDSVTLRAGKNANFRTIMFTFRSLQALIADTETDDAQQQQQNIEKLYIFFLYFGCLAFVCQCCVLFSI